jgi:hypothetical protein
MDVLPLLRSNDAAQLEEPYHEDEPGLKGYTKEQLNPIPPPRSQQRSTAPSPKISLATNPTVDQALQRERSQRKLLKKQVNRQVQALKSSKKRAESLQAVLDRVKNDKVFLHIEVSTLKKQLQEERDLRYKESVLVHKPANDSDKGRQKFPEVNHSIILYRGGLSVSGQLLLVTLTHACEDTARGRPGKRQPVESGGEDACSQCMWRQGGMCVSEEQQLTILAVKLGGIDVFEEGEKIGIQTDSDSSQQLREFECAVNLVEAQAALLEAVLAGPPAVGVELGRRLALESGHLVCIT